MRGEITIESRALCGQERGSTNDASLANSDSGEINMTTPYASHSDVNPGSFDTPMEEFTIEDILEPSFFELSVND